MDDLNYLTRLKIGQEQFLQENTKNQESRKKLLDDYKQLVEKLKTLPNTVSQPTMVPVGNIAFLPGKLVHTNEIMVLLGDNWFAERSAKQSVEIAQRRMEMVEKQLDDLKKEYDHIKGNLDYTEHFEQLKTDTSTREIKEDIPQNYQSNKGKRRIAHKAKHNITPRTVSFNAAGQNKEEITAASNSDDLPFERTINHDELMSRLNKLEREEQEAEDKEHEKIMASIVDGTYGRETSESESTMRGRHVKFRNVGTNSSEDDDIENNVIQFQHTIRARSSSESDIRAIQSKDTILSPADIYEQFSNQSSSHLSDSEESKPLKSILKKDSRSGSTENLKLKPILKNSPEHRPGTPETLLDEPHSILKTPPDTQASDKRPGTPEHILDRPGRQSILKSDEVYFVQDEEDQEIRPILKSNELPPSLNNEQQQYNEETRSILKHSSLDSPIKRPFSPENVSLDSNGSAGSILKNDGRNRKITISPDPPVMWGQEAVENTPVEPKPILKNQMNETQPQKTEKIAFSGTVVERNPKASDNDKVTKKKPMSMFKASRMKK